MFCKCGNDKFYAVKAYTTYESVLVDGCGNLCCMAPPEKHPKSGKIIAHYESEGPFICNKCGRKYNFINGMIVVEGEG